MKNRNMLKFGLTALMFGGLAVSGVATQGFSVSAFAAASPSAKKAASEAKNARKALAKRNAVKAVQHAEAAVANDPLNADYRALLGQAYLLAGRFASATQALSESLTLNPEDGRVALNLTLAKIAQGDWAGARGTLQTHADQIPASDRGLAFALAGDPVTAIDILTPASRDPSATAKTRQNLALSLALAGRWKEASEIAAMDVAPDQLQARVMEWAKFARPANAYDQVASLLNVVPVEDAGQPVALALSQQPGVAVAAVAPATQTESVDAYMPGSTVAAPQPTAAVEATSEPLPEPQQVAGTGAQIVFGPREEIVQLLPASRRAAPVRVAAAPVRAADKPLRAASSKPVRGTYYVQLGAYANAAVARDAWRRHTRLVPSLDDSTPQGANVSNRAGRFYRLSVGGFARSDADSLCRQVKSSGGNCFVRAQAGDAVASWAKGDTRVASR
ncbi:SPOR domain-containing protein [Sphingomonas sp. M1-B02]|uniref:SPOR domain-containing protein n=1 Tax=Sphingomonas sp. M1-B02 TaxID=3114300 RepID=UPI00223E972F|nr:SPOR domain-containing protein [Sphingomonas sp. S6-11]UZK66417.1 SPOR domain-containing protein [Sphingomonas sp. S6-11]